MVSSSSFWQYKDKVKVEYQMKSTHMDTDQDVEMKNKSTMGLEKLTLGLSTVQCPFCNRVVTRNQFARHKKTKVCRLACIPHEIRALEDKIRRLKAEQRALGCV